MKKFLWTEATVDGIKYETSKSTKMAEHRNNATDESWYIEFLYQDNQTKKFFLVCKGGKLSTYHSLDKNHRFVILPLSDDETDTWLANRNLSLSPPQDVVQIRFLMFQESIDKLKSLAASVRTPVPDMITTLAKQFASERNIFEDYKLEHHTGRNSYRTTIPVSTQEIFRQIKDETGASYGYILERMIDIYKK